MTVSGNPRRGKETGVVGSEHERGDRPGDVSAPLESDRPEIRWGRLLLTSLLAVAVGVVVVLVASPSVGGDLEQAGADAAHPEYLVFALLCVVVLLAADAASLAVLVRGYCGGISFLNASRVALESHLVSGATSFGGLEIPYQAWLLRRLGMSLPQITSAILVKGLVHVSILVAVAFAALLPVFRAPLSSPQRSILLGVAVVLAILWLVALVAVFRPFGPRRLLPERVTRRLEAFPEALRELRRAGWRTFSALLALQVIYWAAMLAVIPLVLLALGWRGDVPAMVARQAVLQVIMPFSPLPGGAGVAELGYLQLIGPAIPAGMRVSSLVLWRLLTWVLPMAVGGAFIALRGARRLSIMPGAGET